ncbi:MAG: response regulator, partial [Sphaerochaetaceae bacterium]
NLLNSMLDLTPPQGKVNTTKKITSAKDQDIVEITISSTQGYREEEIKELLQPSVPKEKTEGKTIALTLASNLIGMMGGQLTYTNKEEEGLAFIVILPLVVADRKQDALIDNPVQDKDLSCLEGKNILLAEDHQLSSIIVTRVLTPLGLNVELARDGAQALAMFKKSEVGYYNMILMDIQMPELDGLQASREIRNSSHPDAKSIPIVAMSASVFPKDKEESREAGMYEHLEKPIEVGKLKQVLYKYLH